MIRKNFKAQSKILQKAEVERENIRLFLEIQDARPIISLPLPRGFSHLRVNKKREQIREGIWYLERFTEIERENRILLEKIHNIMQSRPDKSKSHKVSKSLNISYRAKNLRQISIENLGLMHRLQNKKSMYDFKGLVNKTKKQKPGENYFREKGTISSNRAVKLSPISLDMKETVYQNKITLQHKTFSVEISKGNNTIRILMQDMESQDNFSLTLKFKEALRLMQGRQNWEKLLTFLQFDEKNDLVLCETESLNSSKTFD